MYKMFDFKYERKTENFEILKEYSEWENLDPWRNVELTETSGRITVKLTSEFTPNKYVSDIQANYWCQFL